MTMRNKMLLSLSAAVGLSLLTIVATAYQHSKHALQEQTNLRQKEIAQGVAEKIDTWISARIRAVEAVAKPAVAHWSDDAALFALGKTIMDAAAFTTMTFAREDGTYYVPLEWESTADYDPRGDPWYALPKKANAPVVPEPYPYTDPSGEVTFYLSMTTPVAQGGRFLGVVSGDLTMDDIIEMLGTLNLEANGYAMLVNHEGKILVHPDQAHSQANVAALHPQLLRSMQHALNQPHPVFELPFGTRGVFDGRGQRPKYPVVCGDCFGKKDCVCTACKTIACVCGDGRGRGGLDGGGYFVFIGALVDAFEAFGGDDKGAFRQRSGLVCAWRPKG